MNSTISIELVPRSEASIRADLATMAEHFPETRMVNIPDLLRFDLRSWEACAMAGSRLDRAVPHIRAMDFPVKSAGELAAKLRGLGLKEALIVRGDAPQDLARSVHPTASSELIAALKEVDPELVLYAVFDPYRHGLRSELDDVKEKWEAGADGFFTQPFFDLEFLQVCADILPGMNVFWGLAPVLTAGNRRYWEVKNRAFFPSHFEPSLNWNRELAAACIGWAKETEANLYFMPIRLSLTDYLGGLIR